MFRYSRGLGVTTDLADGRPRSIWISFDLLRGVALSVEPFLDAGTVYILHLEKHRYVLRPSLLTGFLGCLMVTVALLVDLGVPFRIWHMIIYWNPHSPLFEVGLCVMTCTTVLALE